MAERLRPESLYRRFVAYREGSGFEVVAADDGRAAHRGAHLAAAPRAVWSACWPTGTWPAPASEVRLFGEPARLPAGPATLAALTGAPLIPAYPGFTPGGWSIPSIGRAGAGRRRPRRPVPAATQAMADAFAELIAAAPADWHMLQPVWTADHPPVRCR